MKLREGRITMQFRDVRPRSMRRGYLHGYRGNFSNLLVVAFVLTFCTALPSIAATITVTSLADDGSAGTLRSAIANATSGDTIVFAVTGTITLVQGVLEINKNLTITNSNLRRIGQVSVSGNNMFQVFYVDPGAAVTISQLSITQGMAPPSTSNVGGGVLNTGTLTLDGVVVSGNSAGNVGGGLYNAGSMTVTNSTVSNNSAPSGDGGGIYNVGTLIISSTSFSGNTAGDVGGGITNYSGTANVSSSVLSGNSASFGGGAIAGANGGGTLTLTNSTLSGNTANTGGGSQHNFRN